MWDGNKDSCGRKLLSVVAIFVISKENRRETNGQVNNQRLFLYVAQLFALRTEEGQIVSCKSLPDKCLEVRLVTLLVTGQGCASGESLSAAWVLADIRPFASVGPTMTSQRR